MSAILKKKTYLCQCFQVLFNVQYPICDNNFILFNRPIKINTNLSNNSLKIITNCMRLNYYIPSSSTFIFSNSSTLNSTRSPIFKTSTRISNFFNFKSPTQNVIVLNFRLFQQFHAKFNKLSLLKKVIDKSFANFKSNLT